MTDVKNGDRVRVVLEGEARGGGGGFFLGAPGSANWIVSHDEHVVSVEVLPRPLKVGDIVEGGANYAALPVGTLVAGHGIYLLRTVSGWRATEHGVGRDYQPDGLDDPRTVVYLPK